MATLWAVADLHAAMTANTAMIDRIQPSSPNDWLIVAGDVAERTPRVVDVLARLRERFDTVVWSPGNHELFCRAQDAARGRDKYDELVEHIRRLGVHTPEDPYPVFAGRTIAPLFTLYDYSLRPQGLSVEEAFARAKAKHLVFTDEYMITPFVDIRAWCWDRLAYSVQRLSKVSGSTILVNHWPLVREPINRLMWPEISLWCGTIHTRHWPLRYHAEAVVYGHLHVPDRTIVDGVTHIEASLGYPREWRQRGAEWVWPAPVLEVAE